MKNVFTTPGVRGVNRPRFQGTGNVTPPPELTITLPPGMTAAFEQLMVDTGKTAGEVMGEALGLYREALKAHKEGKAVGTAPNADGLETEFVGF